MAQTKEKEKERKNKKNEHIKHKDILHGYVMAKKLLFDFKIETLKSYNQHPSS